MSMAMTMGVTRDFVTEIKSKETATATANSIFLSSTLVCDVNVDCNVVVAAAVEVAGIGDFYVVAQKKQRREPAADRIEEWYERRTRKITIMAIARTTTTTTTYPLFFQRQG